MTPSNSGTTASGEEASTSPSGPNSADSPAQITVQMPENAEIWFDGVKRDETGSVRHFTTPMLTAGRHYTHEVHARWKDGDTMIDQTKQVTFGAGDKLDMTFPVPAGSAEKVKEMTQP